MPDDIYQRLVDLNTQAAQLHEDGQYQQAVDIAMEVYELAQRELGDTDIAVSNICIESCGLVVRGLWVVGAAR